MIPIEAVDQVEQSCHKLYLENRTLTFHDWGHIEFVRGKAVEFARMNGADRRTVEVAALVHDLNYLVRPNSEAREGRALRVGLLEDAGLMPEAIDRVESTILAAETKYRQRDPSLEAQALSDADTVYKILPITPVVLSPKYMEENGVDLVELATKIVSEQSSIQEAGYFFYSHEAAERYGRWAQINLDLWRCIKFSIEDEDVQQLLKRTS